MLAINSNFKLRLGWVRSLFYLSLTFILDVKSKIVAFLVSILKIMKAEKSTAIGEFLPPQSRPPGADALFAGFAHN